MSEGQRGAFKKILLTKNNIMEKNYHSKNYTQKAFNNAKQLRKKEQKLIDEFEDCKRVSGKQLMKLVLKDKLMIVLYVLVGLLIAATGLAFAFGW
jgi:hypothetical protein